MNNHSKIMLLGIGLMGLSSLTNPLSAHAANAVQASSNCDISLLNIAGNTLEIPAPKPESNAFQQWKQARALYERDLDYARANAEGNKTDTAVKDDLIEAKYRLSLAEGRLVSENVDKQAISDLQQAHSLFKQSEQRVDPKLKPQLARVEEEMNRILNFISQDKGCWSNKLPPALDTLNQDTERLIRSL